MHARLLRWFDRNRRDLPWRRTRDPWAIWVSEIMLQQTRVEAVRASYERFLATYPSAADFAAASDAEVLIAWRGLGYYRRARLLREGARTVVAEHGGRVPDDVAALGEVPGIGEYTRGAVASIAFGRREIAVDGNVERVVARHRGITTDVKQRPAALRIRATVRSWQSPERPGDFNQALMELGALICTPKAPRCEACPVAEDCEARARGLVARLPVLPERKKARLVNARCVLVRRSDGSVLGAHVPTGAINGGQVELPTPGPLVAVSDGEELVRLLAERFGVGFELEGDPLVVQHTITTHRIAMHAHAARVRARRFATPLGWFSPDAHAVPWTTLSRKVFTRSERGFGLPSRGARG